MLVEVRSVVKPRLNWFKGFEHSSALLLHKDLLVIKDKLATRWYGDLPVEPKRTFNFILISFSKESWINIIQAFIYWLCYSGVEKGGLQVYKFGR